MSTITIVGKDTRVALEAALWHAMSRAAGNIDDELYGCAVAGIRCEDEFPELVEAMRDKFERFERSQRDIRTVWDTATGDGLDADVLESVSEQQLCESLRACADLVEDWEDFWKRSAVVRRAVMWKRDALAEILAELEPVAVA